MPLLVIYFVFATKSFTSALKKWIILALLFSWAGDVLLMFDELNEIFFISGLVAFLWAHVWYIYFFHGVVKAEKLESRTYVFFLVFIYFSFLTDIIRPSSLGILEWPVRIYGAILMVMLGNSFYMALVKRRFVGLISISGALLFVISDSILAIDKFNSPIEYAGLIIMSTYGIGQLLLTLGTAKYITSFPKQ